MSVVRFNRWWLLHLILVAGIALAARELTLLPDGKLHVHFLDIGQGDSELIVTPSGKQIVIDGGPNLTALEHLGDYLPFFDRTIELLILTHPDKDHITALPEILRRYKVEEVLITGIEHSSGPYDAFLHELANRKINVIAANPDEDIDLGDGVILDTVWPPKSAVNSATETNNSSIVIRLLYGEHEILFTGDIEAIVERMILQSGEDIDSDILKVAHHGSRTSSIEEFIDAVSPDLAIISAGRENSYGHPHPDVMERFSARGIEVRQTPTEGTISLEFVSGKRQNAPLH